MIAVNLYLNIQQAKCDASDKQAATSRQNKFIDLECDDS